MRWIVGGKATSGGAASPSQMGRFETQWLAAGNNLSALADLSGQWIDRVVWNGHYECTCYHPLFVFNQFGDLEHCALRPGNVHSADGWRDVLTPVVARYRGKVSRLYFRADAGFANPGVYGFLETNRVKYAISLPANAVRLQLHALACNLGNFLRTLVTPEPIKDWSLTSLKEKLIKIGAKERAEALLRLLKN